MRIGVDARDIKACSTGPGIYAESLVRHLVESESGHEYFLFWSQRDPGITPFGARVEEISVGPRRDSKLEQVRFEQWRVPGLVRRYGLDLWFAPSFFLPLYKSCRQVTTIHDLIWLLMPHEFSLARRLTYNQLLCRNAQQADHVLTVSEASKDDIIRILGLPPDRITVTYNAPAPAFRPLPPAPGDAARLASRGVRTPYFVYASGLLPRKNILRLLDAFEGFVAAEPGRPHQLVLAGGGSLPLGPFRDAVERRLASPLLAGRVVRTGYLAVDDLVFLLNRSVASIYPSLYEGFGFPVVEAMACGTAVITSNVSSMPEIAGGAALLVDPGDSGSIQEALERVATDAQLRQDLVARGLVRVRAFSWREAAARVVEVFERVAGEGRRSSALSQPAVRRAA